MRALEKTLVSCLAHDALHLIVLPAEAFAGRMEPRVVRGLKNLLTDRADELRDLTLSWSGGEPLLARDVVDDVLRHVQVLRAKHPTMRVRSDVSTSGHHLDRAALEQLSSLGADRYHVSVDERTWDDVAALREARGVFKVGLETSVDRGDPHAVAALVDRFSATFGMDERFALTMHDRGGPCRRIHGRARGVALASVPRHSFVVRHDGRVDEYAVAHHPLGRLHESGRLELLGGRLRR